MELETAHLLHCAGMASFVTEDSYPQCLRADARPRGVKSNIGFKVTCYLLNTTLNFNHSKVAHATKSSRSTVSKYVGDIEDLRESYSAFHSKLQSAERNVEAMFVGGAKLV